MFPFRLLSSRSAMTICKAQVLKVISKFQDLVFFESHIDGIGQVLVRVDGESFPSGLLESLLKGSEIDVVLVTSWPRPLAVALPFTNQPASLQSNLFGVLIESADRYGRRFIGKLPEDLCLAEEYGSLDPKVEFLHRLFSESDDGLGLDAGEDCESGMDAI